MEKITREKRQEYLKLRNDFHKERKNLNEHINKSKLKIREHKNKVNELEKTLRKSKPIIEECDNCMNCNNCDIHSMRYEGREPGQGGGTHWYKCVICNQQDYHT